MWDCRFTSTVLKPFTEESCLWFPLWCLFFSSWASAHACLNMSETWRGCFPLMLSVKGITVARKEETAERKTLFYLQVWYVLWREKSLFNTLCGCLSKTGYHRFDCCVCVWIWFGKIWSALIDALQRALMINRLMQKQPSTCQQAVSPPQTRQHMNISTVPADLTLTFCTNDISSLCGSYTAFCTSSSRVCVLLCVPCEVGSVLLLLWTERVSLEVRW